MGINNNSIASAITTPWNASLHSTDTADAWITYNATTMNLRVSWTYQTTPSPPQDSSLSYQIDLRMFLPEWVTVGFSAATSMHMERHQVLSWEFSSSLDIKEPNRKNEKKTRLVVGRTVSIFGVLIAGGIIASVILWRRRQKIMRKETAETINLTSINDDLERGAEPRRFSRTDLVLASNNFSNERKLGEGGFGCVYKGYLNDLDSVVAVKKISRGSTQGKKEYITEFLLVYEFLPNSSLDSHLFGKKICLTWAVRYKIALVLASALLYLHEEWEQCVVHRDIKSSNIMLDSNFNVKLGDFGLARLMDHELGPQTTGLAGTVGYLAPEYISTGKATKESDVFSFGVVALEIASGRKSVDRLGEESEMGLVEWVWDLYGRGNLLLAVDERLHGDYEKKELECLIIVGLSCAHPARNLRPLIRQALQVLNFEATVPNLPTKMPVPMYQVPMSTVSSGEPSITNTSIDIGR
ncbi:hypothetical protein L1049_023638 [Liquidambar formosana]|uniref:Protein kinase domain-containing protein n=1 Tax=Liquidambar formosana TaxID=63359 RepID=A0AAP0S0D8_LIQFO